MQWLKIVGLGLLAAVGYGIVHDQVTARVCVEYFTIGHPPVFGTTSPTLLALGWGIIATWWVGLPLGMGLATAARLGPAPRLTARELRRPVLILLAAMFACAATAGVIGAVLAHNGRVWLVEPLATDVPRDRHVRFLADLWAHSASYAAGLVGGVVLMVWTVLRRRALRARAAVVTQGS